MAPCRRSTPTVVDDFHIAALYPTLRSQVLFELHQSSLECVVGGKAFAARVCAAHFDHEHVFVRVVVERGFEPGDFLGAFEEPDHAAQVYVTRGLVPVRFVPSTIAVNLLVCFRRCGDRARSTNDGHARRDPSGR